MNSKLTISEAEQFDRYTEEVWERLLRLIPEELKKHFDKIRIVIEDRPTPQILAELEGTDLGENPEELCGLHMGTPLVEESLTNPPIFPTRVYLFREAILELADFDGSPGALEDLKEEIAITLLHEIGHYFGLEEHDLDRLGFA